MRRNQEKGACLCSELVSARWTDAFKQRQEAIVNLEEIWRKARFSSSSIRCGLGSR
jgi:hypothetical protein